MRSTESGVFRATVVVAGLGAVAKAIGFVREVLIARSFGVGADVDAYLVAFALCLFVSVLAGAAAQSALVPAFTAAQRVGGDGGSQRLLDNAVLLVAILIIPLGALLAIGAPIVLRGVGAGFDVSTVSAAREMVAILAGVMLCAGLTAVWSAALNARRRFAAPAAVPVANAAVVTAYLLAFGSRFGISGLAIATTVGFVVEAGLIATLASRAGMRIVPRWHGLDESTRNMVRQFLPLVAVGATITGSGLVDQAFASTQGAGSVAVFAYGSRPTLVVLTVVGLALGTAVLPFFSGLASSEGAPAIARLLQRLTLTVFAIGVPIAVVLFVSADALVRIVYVGGEFTASEVDAVADVSRVFALQVPFYLLSVVLARYLSAIYENRLLLGAGAVAFLLNLGLDYVLVTARGVPGVALASSMVQVALCVMLLGAVRMAARRSSRRAGDEDETVGDPRGDVSSELVL